MADSTPITVAHGDGIGPEIMEATLRILHEGGARLAIETIEIGEKVYLRGHTAGIEPSAWESLRRTKAAAAAVLPSSAPSDVRDKVEQLVTREVLPEYDAILSAVDEAYERYRTNLHNIVQTFKKKGVRFIVLGSPGVVDTQTFWGGTDLAAKYNPILANERGGLDNVTAILVKTI